MKRVLCGIVVGAMVVIGGCSSEQPSAPSAPIPAQVEFSDLDLRNDVGVGGVRMWRDSSQLLHVDVPVRNQTQSDLPVDYRVTYFDTNGVPVYAPSGWATVNLSPNVFQDIRVNCSTPRGYDFRMDLRYAR